MKYVLFSTLALALGASCVAGSSSCLAELSEEHLALVQRQASLINDKVTPTSTKQPTTGSQDSEKLSVSEALKWWWISQYSYTGWQLDHSVKNAPSLTELGWRIVGQCVYGTAKAKVFERIGDGVMAVGFSGTDFLSLTDWSKNFAAAYKWVKPTAEGHPPGFQGEVEVTAPCINRLLNGTKADYVVGHSQGGADAVIYWKLAHLGKWDPKPTSSKAQVVTFGAAKTTANSSCNTPVPGHRLYHHMDPVAGDIRWCLDQWNYPNKCWWPRFNFDQYKHDTKHNYRFTTDCPWGTLGKCTRRSEQGSSCQAIQKTSYYERLSMFPNIFAWHANYANYMWGDYWGKGLSVE